MKTIRDLLFVAALLGALHALCAAPLAAQQPDTLVVTTDTVPATQTDVELPELDEPTTPGGAMLRAVLLPGWGHASIGSYQRGAFYFAAEATSGFMLTRTVMRLSRAKDARALAEMRLTAALEAEGVTADSAIAARLDEDAEVRDKRGLVNARQQQLEDWIAFGAFLVFIGGADAFVSAHLRDFPDPISPRAEFVPGPTGARMSVGLSVAVGPGSPARPRR